VILVVMGVAGSGKTTLGRAIAARLGWPFLEGDDLHPPANRAKMAAGIALDDADRAPWLQAVSDWIGDRLAAGGSGVVACSALKRAYRETLAKDRPDVWFVLQDGPREVLEARLKLRQGHFMPPSLLDSQLKTLERPGADEQAVTVDLRLPVEEQMARALAALPA
jgi:gluconokinase